MLRSPEMQNSPKKDEKNAERTGPALKIQHSAQMRFLAQEFPPELIPDRRAELTPLGHPTTALL